MTTRLLLSVALAAMAGTIGRATENPATRRLPSAPLPARHYHPIQLVFLGLPVDSARLTAGGSWELSFAWAETNTLASTSARSETPLFFDLETSRLAFGLRYGVSERWELSAELPFIYRWGGFLDPIIEEVESAVDRLNPKRVDGPENVVRFVLARGSTPIFAFDDNEFGLGDTTLAARVRLAHVVSARERATGTTLVSARAAVKLPTGDEDELLGSGELDVGLGIDLTREWSRWALYASAAVIVPGNPDWLVLETDPFWTAGTGFEYRWSPRSSLLAQLAHYQSAFDEGALELTQDTYELGLGVNIDLGGRLMLQVGGIENLTVRPAADISLITRLIWHVD
ncbi:MAG: DUF3187 family protein [Acidobacteriota bacterium]|nr:MAG: DUF3187 family protein [Acidobacteriota bacterium]